MENGAESEITPDIAQEIVKVKKASRRLLDVMRDEFPEKDVGSFVGYLGKVLCVVTSSTIKALRDTVGEDAANRWGEILEQSIAKDRSELGLHASLHNMSRIYNA